jgi:hypothetical protein
MSTSKWARINRINRKLSKSGERLRVSRGWQMIHNVGEMYILDLYRNCVVMLNVDLDQLELDLMESKLNA